MGNRFAISVKCFFFSVPAAVKIHIYYTTGVPKSFADLLGFDSSAGVRREAAYPYKYGIAGLPWG
jgi:hypothetical protein